MIRLTLKGGGPVDIDPARIAFVREVNPRDFWSPRYAVIGFEGGGGVAVSETVEQIAELTKPAPDDSAEGKE